jgi:quinol monooxygenase YgiN
MYARSTTIRGNPQAMDDGISYVRDKAMPAVLQMDGCVGLSMFYDRETGRSIVTSAWADAETLRRSADGVTAMRERAAEIMGGPAEVQEWEIAVLHRLHGIHYGACARVIWTEGDPAQLDRMVDAFRMSVIPRVAELPGFDSVSLMIDRESGGCATSVIYDCRESRKEAEAPGMALRPEFTQQMGMTVTEVAVFDVALAHLRVPETV